MSVKLNSTSYLVASAAVEYFAGFVLGHYQDPSNYYAAFLHWPGHLVPLADRAAHTLEADLDTVVAHCTWVLARTDFLLEVAFCPEEHCIPDSEVVTSADRSYHSLPGTADSVAVVVARSCSHSPNRRPAWDLHSLVDIHYPIRHPVPGHSHHSHHNHHNRYTDCCVLPVVVLVEAPDYSTDAAEVAGSLSTGHMPWRFVMEDSLSAKIPRAIDQRSGSLVCIVREKRKADRAIYGDSSEAHRLITSPKLVEWGIIRRCSRTGRV